MPDIFSSTFLYALGAIILIDLVLAGDNALVIAMAARNLPDHLRKQAILWGTFGAIAVRAVMTFAVVWLLQIPGLLAIGGIALVWIAVRLLAPKSDDAHNLAADVGFWGAMKTIVIADAVMGVDNVLAVAGAAHGSYLLVILGLLISIPIVVWGSSIVLKLIDRFPAIIYLGALVLALTAAKMIVSEPMVAEYLGDITGLNWIIYAAAVGLTLGMGHWLNQRKSGAGLESSVQTSLNAVLPASDLAAAALSRILVPVDTSPSAQAAVAHVLRRAPRDAQGRIAAEIHLVHVLPRLTRNTTRFLTTAMRAQYKDTRTVAAIAPYQARLEAAGATVVVHVPKTRDAAGEIAEIARRIRADHIVMSTRRSDAMVRWITGSLASRVIDRADVPVEVVVSGQIPKWRRVGIPVGLGVMVVALAWD